MSPTCSFVIEEAKKERSKCRDSAITSIRILPKRSIYFNQSRTSSLNLDGSAGNRFFPWRGVSFATF